MTEKSQNADSGKEIKEKIYSDRNCKGFQLFERTLMFGDGHLILKEGRGVGLHFFEINILT